VQEEVKDDQKQDNQEKEPDFLDIRMRIAISIVRVRVYLKRTWYVEVFNHELSGLDSLKSRLEDINE